MQNVPQEGFEPATAILAICETDRTDEHGHLTDALRRRSNGRESQFSCMLILQLPSLISQLGLNMPIRDPMFIFVISTSPS